ncbi:MAG TPA: IPT/TIG domain-containing protein, partial [Bryobacteraceae bacterium]
NNTVYMGSAAGGVWKTTDGGANWKPLTDNQPSLSNGSIALDPAHPDTVYVGTGEENFSYDSYYGVGILKSTDGGNTWTNIVGPFLRAKIGGLAINPNNTQILLASSTLGIYRSTDGAATWTRVQTGTGTSVLFDPTNSNIAYAGIGNIFGSTLNGVYRSTDGGQTWQRSTGSGANSLPTTNVGRVEVAIAPSTPSTLYAGIHNDSTDNLLGIYKTTDGGNTWNNLSAPNICQGLAQCWYDLTLRVNPKNPDMVVAAGSLRMARTFDGGSTWTQTTLPYLGPNQVRIHTDWHYLAFTPDGTKLYVANDGGMYSSTDISNSLPNWTELNDTLAITQFYPGLSIHPSDASIGLAGTQDNRTQRFSGNMSWNVVTCGDGGYTAIDPSQPSFAIAACTSSNNPTIQQSSNAGTNWISAQYGIDRSASERVDFIPPVTMDASNGRTLYYGTSRVWQSRDGGGKWLPISPDVTGGTVGTVQTIAVAPSDSNTVYVGSSDGLRITQVSSKSRVQVSNNALAGTGASFADRSSGLPTKVITQIAIDPIDPATAYAGFSGFSTVTPTAHVFKTTNSGQNWTDISGNLPDVPVNTLVVDPDIANTIYIGTDAGVMVTTDGGVTWSSLGNGLPRVVVHSLVLHRNSRTLRAATHGRSVWDILVPLASKSLQPSIASVSPSTANAGGADFSLTLTGANFVTGTKLRWNGLSRPTNIIDSTHLVAQIGAGDIAQVGRASIDVLSLSRGTGASNSVAFNIGPSPATTPASFVSAANPTGGNRLAPGSLASLYGTNLSGSVSAADFAPPLPVTLNGTSITIAGTATPLLYVSPGQINLQVPWFVISGPSTGTLTVNQGQLNASINVVLTPFAPALFTTNSGGSGQAAALINNTATLVAPAGAFPGSRPAAKGEFIQLYCTGLGDVTNRPLTGAAATDSPLSMTASPATVTIGSVSVTPVFSGLSPGFVGLYQVNLQVPQNAPSGPAVPVVLTIGGVASNTATIAIQ